MSEPILLSTALFPPIDYMALLLFHHEVYIESYENYQKQSYRNRYYIIGPNGVQLLQIPVRKETSCNHPIQEVMVGGPLPWQKIHCRSIETAYSNAPWFAHFYDQVENLLTQGCSHLWSFNLRMLYEIAEMLGIQASWKYTMHYDKQAFGYEDLRSAIHPRQRHSRFPIIPYEESYQQVFMEKHGFVPHLCILDLLFNEGPAASGWLQRRYRSLIEPLQKNRKNY
jgi:hypothetical protein